MAPIALLQTSPVTPDKWMELLKTYGPIALFVFMVFVLLGMARRISGLSPQQQKVQLAALSLVWACIFALAVVIVIAWWRANFPPEFVVKGVLRNLRDPETVSTSQEMYMRVHPIAGLDFEYEWRFITPQKFAGDVTLRLQKNAASDQVLHALKYKFPIRPDYYTGNADVEIEYDRETGNMTVTRNGSAAQIIPAQPERASNAPPPDRRDPSVVYAQNDSKQASVADLMTGLEADNPVIREKAREDVAARGAAALPELQSALNGSSARLRAGALAALIVMTQRGMTSLPDPMRCAIAGLAAADPDRLTRSEAWQLIGAGVRPGPGCSVPHAIDEIKTQSPPIALAYHPESGLFALDRPGRVYRVGVEGKSEPIQLFSLPASTVALDLAAGPRAVVVAGVTNMGKLFVFTLATGKLSQITLAVRRFGLGLAVDADTVYLGTADPYGHEVEAWDLARGQKQRVWPLNGFKSVGPMILDEAQHKLLVTDPAASRISALTLADGKIKLLSDQVGAVTAVAVSARNYLFGSGGKILFLSRSSGLGENPPPGVNAMVFKNVSGLAVDKSGDLWVSDFDRKVIKGPIMLR